MECVFCREDGGEVLWQDDAVRVVLATGEHDYPGFCRVIWARTWPNSPISANRSGHI